MKRFLSIAIRIVISATLLGLLYREHSLVDHVGPHLRSLLHEWRWTLTGIISAGLGTFTSAWRWWVVLRKQVPGASFGLALRATLVGGFFNITSLGPIGADTYRILAVRKHYPKQGMSIGASVVIDHLTGLIAMAVMFLGFGVAALKQWPGQAAEVQALLRGFSSFLTIASLGIGLSIFSLSPIMMNWGRRHLPRLMKQKFVIKMEESFQPLWRTWPSTVAASAISIIVFFFTFFAFYCGIHAVGGQAPLLPVMIAMPVVDMAAALPISVSGLGVREKTFETLMAAFVGLPVPTGIAASLAGWLFNVFWGLIGGVVFVVSKSKHPEAEPALVPNAN